MAAKKQLQQIIGLLAGGALGFYCGAAIFIPFIGGWIAGSLAKRFASKSFQPFAPALAVICGQGFSMLAGGLLLTCLKHVPLQQSLFPVSVDLVAIIVGILWLLYRPGLAPVIFLSVYEALVLVVNVIVISALHFGSASHKALTLHIILRLTALGLLFVGYRQFKKVAGEELPAEILPQGQVMASIHVLTEDGRQSVYEESQIRDLLARKVLTPETYYWREGMKDWQPLGDLALRK